MHSLRLEHLRYDYENRHLTGNSRDDGSPCSFGGCLYTRPASREDRFTEVAGRLGVERDFGARRSGYVMLSSGFRPPQATELYRLQQGQTVADLDSERLAVGGGRLSQRCLVGVGLRPVEPRLHFP